MLKSAEEIRKMIDEREYAVNSIAVEDSIYWMVKNRGTYTFAVIKSHRLIDELKNLGYTVEPRKDSSNPNMWKISI